jgi:hypothetical protein
LENGQNVVSLMPQEKCVLSPEGKLSLMPQEKCVHLALQEEQPLWVVSTYHVGKKLWATAGRLQVARRAQIATQA